MDFGQALYGREPCTDLLIHFPASSSPTECYEISSEALTGLTAPHEERHRPFYRITWACRHRLLELDR